MEYFREAFTDHERSILERYFTSVDGPVFALIDLPEVVRTALFARYSRSAKSMRRLFLDEFAGRLDETSNLQDPGEPAAGGDVDTARASGLFDRIFTEYGDDSVAQLGGAHVACEQASNILTKVLERGRLASYLEQSTRYIYFDKPLGGAYRYGVPTEIAAGGLTQLYRETMDMLFRTYSELVPPLSDHYGTLVPRPAQVTDVAWRASVRARVCDDLRGLLPASTLSNVGIYASGQAFEALIIKMRSHPLAEVKAYAEMLLTELRKVIPFFVKRVDIPDRGRRWSAYFAEIDERMKAASAFLEQHSGAEERPEVLLTEWDPAAEVKLAAAALYGYSQLPDDQLLSIAQGMTGDARRDLIRTYCGDRKNRRHRPGRAMERAVYRFDVVAPYSVFRDLQRHRLLTIEWQTLSTLHGYDVPAGVEAIGAVEPWHRAMGEAAGLHEQLQRSAGREAAQYAVPLAWKIRFNWHVNARELFHILELRTQSGGDPAYRRICQEIHRLIREQAGHGAIADAMSFVDTSDYELGRLDGERRAAERLAVLETQRQGPG